MLRELDAQEWLDWRVLETIDPYGQLREDYRFAKLSRVIASALGFKKADSTAWTTEDFLLRFEGPPPPFAALPRQTAEDIEAVVLGWARGSNVALAKG